jgi:hypothetical protein
VCVLLSSSDVAGFLLLLLCLNIVFVCVNVFAIVANSSFAHKSNTVKLV